MDFLKKYFLYNNNIAKRFSIAFVLIGIASLMLLDSFIENYVHQYQFLENSPKYLGLLYFLLTGVLIFVVLNHMQKVIERIDESYQMLKFEDRQKLMPYEFALDNSVDEIHWFTLDGKLIYANKATCKNLGYTKKELEGMTLEDFDPNFTRETAKNCMADIRDIPNWSLESIHIRKDGTEYPVEVTGHGFTYQGKEYICAFSRDVTQKKAFQTKITTINKELQKSLAEKEILLKEIHHRVKNNMEIISSLLNMQHRRSNDEEIKYILKQSISRINTMALVHEFLYLGENLASISIDEYILKLVKDIKELYLSKNTKLDVDLHVSKIVFSANRCIQIGMVMHELCVNALKYAFKEDRSNLLCIHIKRVGESIHIKIRDNGDGIQDIDSLYKTDSIGMQLINTIVEDQLDGEIEFKNNSGLECNIVFKEEEEEWKR